jgi:hypothetical protein
MRSILRAKLHIFGASKKEKTYQYKPRAGVIARGSRPAAGGKFGNFSLELR